jgi:hypothetical protein
LDRHHPPKDCAAHLVRLRPLGAEQLQRPKSQHPLPVDVQLTSGGQRPVTWHLFVGIIREAGVYTLESGGPYSLLIGTQHTPRDTASRRATPRQAGVPSPAGRRTRRASGASGGRSASRRRPRPRKTEECSDEGGDGGAAGSDGAFVVVVMVVVVVLPNDLAPPNPSNASSSSRETKSGSPVASTPSGRSSTCGAFQRSPRGAFGVRGTAAGGGS